MFVSDDMLRGHVVALAREPLALEPRVWIAAGLASQADPRGIKLLREIFDQCLMIGEPVYALWAALAVKTHAPLENVHPLFMRFAMRRSTDP